MSAYFIVHRRNISDSDTLKDYRKGVGKTIEAHGGEVIVRSDNFEVLEGNWTPGMKDMDSRPERITIIRFPDMMALKTWYDSGEYGEFKKIRVTSSDSDVVATEGATAD